MKPEECTIPVHRPKTIEMLFFFACGVILSIPVTAAVYSLVNPLLTNFTQLTAALLLYTFFAPFVEEFAKIFPLYYRHGETQRSILNLAIMVGLGFAIVELLEYVFLLGVPIIFRLSGLFFHSSSTAIAAYGIATKRPIRFYLLAVALHFSYNFLALTNPFPFTPAYIIVGIAVSLAYTFYGRTTEKTIQYS